MGLKRINARGRAMANAEFRAVTFALSANELPEAAAAGTIIGQINATGSYAGALTYSLHDSAGGTIALGPSRTLMAGSTASDHGESETLTPIIKVTAPGGGVRYLTFSIDVIATIPAGGETVKGTGRKLVDVSTALAAVGEATPITVTVTGPVTLAAWTTWGVHRVADGSSFVFYKRELVDMLGAFTTGAAAGAEGNWNFDWGSGQHDVEFTVSTAPVLTWNMGASSAGGCAGFPLTEISNNNFTIVSQSTSGAFVIRGDTTPKRVTWAYNPTTLARLNTNPTIGDAAYTVTVRDDATASEYTITFNVIANQYDCHHIFHVKNALTSTLSAGAKVVLEDGLFSDGSNTTTANPAAGSRTGVLPTEYDDDGWITVSSRSYLGATLYRFNLQSNRQNGQYVRFTNLVNGAAGITGLSFTATATGGSNLRKQSWLRVDHCEVRAPINFDNTANQTEYCFAVDNHLYGNAGIVMRARNSWIVGNFSDGNAGDLFQHSLYNTADRSGFSRIAWNFAINKYEYDTASHVDFSQGLYNSTTASGLSAGDWEGPDFIGNAFLRGVPPLNENGDVALDGQGVYMKDIQTTGVRIRSRIGGYIYQGAHRHGIYLAKAAPGTVVRGIVMLYPFGVTTYSSGATSPTITLADATSAAVTIDRVVASGDTYSRDTTSVPVPTVTNSYGGVNQATAEAYFADPMALLSATITLPEVIEALTPIHPSLTDPSPDIGAVTSLINFRTRTYDAALFA